MTILLNAFLNYGLIFGKFGFPKLGLVGAGVGSSCANTVMFLGMVLVVSLNRHFRRNHLFGYFWHPDWPRFRHLFPTLKTPYLAFSRLSYVITHETS